MRHGSAVARCAWWWVLWLSSAGLAATVDFETVAAGTRFGGEATPPNAPGQIVLTQEGIDMSVENFLVDSFTGFFTAEVGGRHTETFATQALAVDNIGLVFDFTGVGFPVDLVTLEFADFGGTSNFAVNGEALQIIDPLADLSANVAPGVTADVDNGRITLTSDSMTITSVRIGGQELVLDNITAVPEPVSGLLLWVGAAFLCGGGRGFRRAYLGRYGRR